MRTVIVLGEPAIKALQQGMFAKTGLRRFTWKRFSNVDKLSLEQRKQLIDDFDL